MKSESESSSFRPWLFVIFAFLLLITAWTSLIFVAARFSPEEIPVLTGDSQH